MRLKTFGRIAAGIALLLAPLAPAQATEAAALESAFDTAFGTDMRAPRDYNPSYDNPLAERIALVADGRQGRIGVAAVDLSTGMEIAVLGDQRFPMASTSKIAVAATFLEGVDQGRWSLNDRFPLLVPVRSARFSSEVAPVRHGESLTALELIDLMITRSSNPATDALLAVVGGPDAVNDWVRRAGIQEFTLSRDIATLVRDDGEIDPAVAVDIRDSATPRAMTRMLSGLYQGEWLSAASRDIIISTMERTRTGTRRIRALLPSGVTVAHKTGSLNNTSSDIGIITTPDGRSIAVAIYVTGQGTRANREVKIANIARSIYTGYQEAPGTQWVSASY